MINSHAGLSLVFEV